MDKLVQKLTSRKFWAAIAGLVAGIAMFFGLDESVITTVSGAVVAIASVITYIVTEGRIDIEALKKAVDETGKAVDAITDATKDEEVGAGDA